MINMDLEKITSIAQLRDLIYAEMDSRGTNRLTVNFIRPGWGLKNIVLDEPELVGTNLEVKNDSKFSEDI